MPNPPRYADDEDEPDDWYDENEDDSDRTNRRSAPANAPAASTAAGLPLPNSYSGSAVPSSSRPGYVAVRKRKRRRAAEPTRPAAGTVHIALLALIGGLIVLSLVGQGLRHQVIASLRGVAPALAGFARYRIELVALILAAVVVIYLMPGVEERVLTLLGIKRRHHRRGEDPRDRR